MKDSDPLVARFRTISFARLERIEAGWTALTRGAASPPQEEEVFRELHTLKGDARLIGFSAAAQLAQRLEDVLFAARERRFRVHDEVDIVVGMALQFIGMLLRGRADTPQAGIDIEGFLAQIEGVLADLASDVSGRHPLAEPLPLLGDLATRLSSAGREQLAMAATSVYLEKLRVLEPSRRRLGNVWTTLSAIVSELDAVPIAPLLERHAAAATSLAKDIGKRVTVVSEHNDVRVSGAAFDAVAIAILHALRNAVDHGVEPPAERLRSGKTETATIRVVASVDKTLLRVTVEDDGRGIDLERIRARAVELGLLEREAGRLAGEQELLELVSSPRLTTRADADPISGRGIGMSAAETAIASAGGHMTLGTRAGAGTTLTVVLPQRQLTLDVHTFRSRDASILFAVPATWSVEDAGRAPALDPMALLELPSRPIATTESVAVRFRYLDRGLVLGMLERPVRATAERICPTPPSDPIEIVSVDGHEALLLHPEAFAQRVGRP